MKTTITFCTMAAAMALLMTSCSPVITPLDTSKIHYRDENLNYVEFQRSSVAILPVVTEQRPDAITLKQQSGAALYKSMKKQFPEMKIVSPDTSATLINNADLSGDYAHLIDDYKISGILRKSTLSKLQVATGCRYLLYTELQKIGYPSSVTTKSGAIYNVMPVVAEFAYNSEIWDAENSLLVWKGKGGEARSATDTVITNDNMLLPLAANNLTKRLMWNNANIKDGENPKNLEYTIESNEGMKVFAGVLIIPAMLTFLILGLSHH